MKKSLPLLRSNKWKRKNQRDILKDYFSFDVLDISDISGKNAPGKVTKVDSVINGVDASYATATLQELNVPTPAEMNESVAKRIQRSREGVRGAVLDTYEKALRWSNHEDFFRSDEGKRATDLAIDHYVRNGSDNSAIARGVPLGCPSSPVLHLHFAGVHFALKDNDYFRALKVSLRAEEFPDAAQYARRLGKENLSDLLLRRGMDYARANDIPGLYYRCAERLGLDNVVRFGKLRRIVEAVEKKQYFDAAKSLEEYGLMQRAVEYWRADVNRAKVMASYLSDINHTKKEELLHDPQYGYSQEYIAMLNTVRNGISSAFFNEWKDDVQEIYEVYRNLPKPHHMSVETDMKNSGVRYTKWWLK